ncbi:LysR family transcriptional regulator [Kiloniella sp. b19]|uniref:LysR family transcriptional regulator n=1 Tax=Kiloniella sp. GXU_MW_B19 TaxID=3141326 RepID=UPI0031D245B8
MNRFRKNLPSLDALVFFEAAARTLSFSRAAEELYVTQVAVSKRIRGLEEELSVRLFVRTGRQLSLTPAGQRLQERVRPALGFLDEAVALCQQEGLRRQSAIQLVCNQHLNFFWLAPLLREFQLNEGGGMVSVVTANNLVDVITAETDVAVFYGKAPPAGWDVEFLFRDILVPVTAPGVVGQAASLPILEYEREAPDWLNWSNVPRHLERFGLGEAEVLPCRSFVETISLAMRGKGIALGVLPLLVNELAEGRLTTVGSYSWDTGRCYYFATPKGREVSEATASLKAHLLGAVQNISCKEPFSEL